MWDYSKERFNLKGRICLKFSLYWIFLTWLNILFVQPLIFSVVGRISSNFQYFLSGALLMYFAMDFIQSSSLYFNFAESLEKFKKMIISRTSIMPFQLFSDNKFSLELKRFLKPLYAFPVLAAEIQKNWKLFPAKFNEMINKSVGLYHSRMNVMESGYIKDDKDLFQSLISDVTGHPEFIKLKQYRHHGNSIYYHNLKVAWVSFKLGKFLRLNLREIVKGALLHDFFFSDCCLSKKPKIC